MRRMNKWLALAGAGITLLMVAESGAGAQPAVLKGVRYSVQEASSKLVLRFDGEVQYTRVRQGDGLTILFPQAGVGAPPGTSEIKFRQGLVRSFRAEPLHGDSLAVRLVLRDHAAASVKLAATKNCVIVEAAPEKKPGPIDIAEATGLASLNSAHQLRLMCDSTAVQAAMPGGRFSSLSLWVFLVLVPVLTTALLLIMIGKRKRSTSGSPAATAPEREEQPEEAEYNHWESQVEDRQDDVDERAFRLAKNFNRGKEELDLAFRLQGETRATGIRKEVDSMGKGKKGDAGRLKTAKKLGVGRGEVDLAVRLREFKQKHTDKQEGA